MFTTSTETVTSSTERKLFTCDLCGFTDTVEDRLVWHFGEQHAVKAVRHCGEESFYWLEDETSFEAWLRHTSSRQDRRRDTRSKFLEPGWYRLTTWEAPCPRYCCTDRWIGAEFASEVLTTLREELLERARTVAALRNLLRETP